jgi:hypothetical protein
MPGVVGKTLWKNTPDGVSNNLTGLEETTGFNQALSGSRIVLKERTALSMHMWLEVCKPSYSLAEEVQISKC